MGGLQSFLEAGLVTNYIVDLGSYRRSTVSIKVRFTGLKHDQGAFIARLLRTNIYPKQKKTDRCARRGRGEDRETAKHLILVPKIYRRTRRSRKWRKTSEKSVLGCKHSDRN